MLDQEDIATVFSVLDAKEALKAKQSFFHQFERNPKAISGFLKWVDFNAQGKFQRGSVCDVYDQTATFIQDPEDDPDIEVVCSMVEDGLSKPGTIRPVPNQQAFLWLLPHNALGTEPVEAPILRALFIRHEIFFDVLDKFNPGSGLTAAEKRVICQLSIGFGLRQAAELDSVSFETKRSQLKSACVKLDCTSQNDIVRLALGQLVHLFSLSQVEGDHARVAEEFLATHCPPGAQLKIHRLSSGRFLRVIECGPKSGEPVLLVHSMMFSLFLNNAAPFLKEHNVRLIMPLRPGYLEAGPNRLLDTSDFVGAYIQDLAEYLTATRVAPVKCLGHSMGCILLLRFAVLYPELVSRLTLVSFLMRNDAYVKESLFQRFGESLARLVATPLAFKFLAREFRRRYSTVAAVRTAIRRLFADSEPDIAAFEGDDQRPSSYASFHASYQSSYVGVAEDFVMFFQRRYASVIKAVEKPVHFVHADMDPATPLEVVEGMLQPARGDRVSVVKGAGQMCFGSHPSEVWGHISSWLTPPLK